MTVVAANQLKQRMDARRIRIPVLTATHIYENTLVYITAAGYADVDDAAGLNRFAGVAVKEVNNTGASGAEFVEVEREGAFLLIGTYTQASVGLAVFGIDNYTVQHGNTLASYVGMVVEYVSATLAWVSLGDRSIAGGTITAQAVNNVHDTTPTAAELAVSFGAAASLGRGFIGTIDDNDGDAISYIVWTTDASFYFVKGTKAA
jgi:hypothetical protein